MGKREGAGERRVEDNERMHGRGRERERTLKSLEVDGYVGRRGIHLEIQ